MIELITNAFEVFSNKKIRFIWVLGILLVPFYMLSCNIDKEKESSSILCISQSIVIDSVTSDFPVDFSFIDTPKWQFVAYYNKHRNLTVASRRIEQSNWNYKVLSTRVGWDSHNRIAMTLDRDSCIHVTGNMHNDSITYFISREPLDVSTLQKVFPMVEAGDELSSTYPGFTKLHNNQLIFSYRKGGSGNGITISNIYNEESKSFRRLTDQPLFDGLKQMSAYASGPRKGKDGWFHVVWLWRNTPHCETNHHLSYARSRDLINWETVDGRKVDLPITPNKKEFTVDPAPPGGGMINGAFRLFFDQNNQPMLVYLKYDLAGNNQLYIAKYANNGWESKQVTNWDYRWEFKGPGSINFEIRIRGAQVDKNNVVKIGYMHKQKGEGEITLDLNTLTTIKEEKVIAGVKESPYPQELLAVQSEIEGMGVRWLKGRSHSDKNDFYVLRWETLGKRRFYKAPENPIEPSILKLYKLTWEK